MNRVRLTLSCPRAVGEQIVEHMLESSLLPHGFLTADGSGHGADFAGASLREKVRGRIDVTLVIAVLPQAGVAPLLEELRGRFRSPQVRYWTEPVDEFGDLA